MAMGKLKLEPNNVQRRVQSASVGVHAPRQLFRQSGATADPKLGMALRRQLLEMRDRSRIQFQACNNEHPKHDGAMFSLRRITRSKTFMNCSRVLDGAKLLLEARRVAVHRLLNTRTSSSSITEGEAGRSRNHPRTRLNVAAVGALPHLWIVCPRGPRKVSPRGQNFAALAEFPEEVYTRDLAEIQNPRRSSGDFGEACPLGLTFLGPFKVWPSSDVPAPNAALATVATSANSASASNSANAKGGRRRRRAICSTPWLASLGLMASLGYPPEPGKLKGKRCNR